MKHLQEKLTELGTQCDQGEITLEEYLDGIEQFEADNAEIVQKKFGRRKDTRTLKEFAADLWRNERKEKGHAEWWFENYAHEHFEGFEEFKCVGVDQRGFLFFDRKEIDMPDYQLYPDGPLIEIKDAPVTWKATYKEANFRDYQKRRAWVLTIHRDRFDDLEARSFYTLISPEMLDIILDECLLIPKRKEVGYKPSYQFYFDDEKKLEWIQQRNRVDLRAAPYQRYLEKYSV